MSFWKKLSLTAYTMIKTIAALFLILLIVGQLVARFIYPFEKPLAYAVGLFLGCAFSMLKVVLLERALEGSADMEGEGAKNYATIQVVLRYVLTIVVLLSAVFFPAYVGLFGMILGILSLQISAYITSVLLKDKII